jgi:hypothetical protein
MTRSPQPITLPPDLGRRIVELAQVAADMHQQSMKTAGGTGDETSTDGAATELPTAGFWRRVLDRIR